MAASPVTSELDSAGVLGGSRDMEADNTSTSPEIGGTQVNTNGDAFNISNASCCSGSGILTYDGDDNDPLTVDTVGLGGVDLTNGGEINGRLVFTVVTNDFDFPFDLTIWDGTTSQTANGGTGGGLPLGATPVDISVPYTDFGALDLTSVGAIQIAFRGPNQGDLTIDNFRYVTDRPVNGEIPLPASLPMLIGALGGLGFLSWRRRQG